MSRGVGLVDEARLQGRLWGPELLRPVLWMDAADLSTIAFDASGVFAWRDKSGRGNHGAQGASDRRPSYAPTGLMGRPTILFEPLSAGSGIGDRITVAHSASLDPAASSIFGVVADDGALDTGFGGVRAWIEKAEASSGFVRKYWLGSVGSASGFPDATSDLGEGRTVTSFGQANKAPQIVASLKPATQAEGPARLFQNGVQTAFDAEFTNLVGNTSVLDIGSTHFPWIGRVSEVLFFPAALPDRERNAIEGYLSWKWGIRLAATHPFVNRPPLTGD